MDDVAAILLGLLILALAVIDNARADDVREYRSTDREVRITERSRGTSSTLVDQRGRKVGYCVPRGSSRSCFIDVEKVERKDR